MSDGLKTNFYDIPDWVGNVDDLAEYLELRFDEGNSLKAIFGVAITRMKKETRHKGTSAMRDGNKLFHYAGRIKLRLEKDEI